MVTEQININEFYWGVKTKFKLEIGLKNKLTNQYAAGENSIYPDIVWFPQGTFIVSAFNTSIGTNSCTIALSGKDKMCMLNGELGGQLFASIDFGTEEIEIKSMKQITDFQDVSSDTLMTNTYYMKLSSDDYGNILTSNKLYSLVVSDEGFYYKNGNEYLFKGDSTDHDKLYDVYKLVTDPNELFEQVSIQEYEKNRYYYQKYPSYYVLDNAVSQSPNRQYYQLIPLYKEEYTYSKVQIPLEKIIREAVHAYAKEPYHNIIINDLDDYGLEQLTYKGDKPLFAIRSYATGHYVNMALSDQIKNSDSIEDAVYLFNTNKTDVDITINGVSFMWEPLVSDYTSAQGTPLKLNSVTKTYSMVTSEYAANHPEECYTIAKILYGTDVGYRITDLVYAGDLISAIGDSLTSVLDKIKTMLGDFEYFYDIQGHFVFQRKRTYVNTSWSQLTETDDESYVDYVNSDRKKFSFNFEGNRLVSAVQNSPALTNLRNDFSVWGKRKSLSGAEIPIHARYAIDKKPVFYKTLSGKSYTVSERYAIEQLDIDYDISPEDIYNQIKNFNMAYELPTVLKSHQPRKNGDGSWTPGWWDIRDWAAYYKLLTDTTEDPNGTMKFYSRGDENGCVPVGSLSDDYNDFSSYSANTCVWLITISKNGRINTGHGRGVFGTQSTLCTYYTSFLADDRIQYIPTDRTQYFYYPYSGCNDRHTYLYFLNQIKPYDEAEENEIVGVYFYNPDFPDVSYEQLVEDKIANAYENWKKDNQVYIVDWREIIYQMALDFFAGQGCSEEEPLHISDDGILSDPDHFLYEVAVRNPYYYPTGITGYEQYYTDMEGFWRQLYNPDYVPVAEYQMGQYNDKTVQGTNSVYFTKTKEWSGMTLSDYIIDYYVDKNSDQVEAEYAELCRQIAAAGTGSEQAEQLMRAKEKFDKYQISPTSDDEERIRRLYWNTAVFENPESLNFWIEFLDDGIELAQFAVPMVGDRSKTVNDDKATAIVFKEIPDLILYNIFDSDGTGPDYSKIRKEITEESGYTFIYLPKGFSQYLNISYRSNSVKNKVDELLYQYAYCIENITITAIPIYYLEPNTRIYVQDKTTQINGEYIVSKITLPLTYNGTMSITATKAPERLY